MKKISTVKKIILLTLLVAMGTTTMSFADLYVSPTRTFIITIPIIGIVLIVLAVLLIIDLVSMLVGKITKEKELISKTKKYAESLFYYILFLIGLLVAFIIFSTFFIMSILPFALIICSLYQRLNKNNKKNSYIIIGVYLFLILFCISGIFIEAYL